MYKYTPRKDILKQRSRYFNRKANVLLPRWRQHSLIIDHKGLCNFEEKLGREISRGNYSRPYLKDYLRVECYSKTRRQYIPVNGWLVERKWFDEEEV